MPKLFENFDVSSRKEGYTFLAKGKGNQARQGWKKKKRCEKSPGILL
ncbi:MAG: hypothetical protein ACTSXU_02320 [Promethearchaeota archaeon]